MDKVYEMNYEMYLAEEMMEQAAMSRYIDEAILIGQNKNTIDSIKVLNEGYVDKLKAGITKIAHAIGTIWQKFLETLNTLVKKDKDYLDRYKDIILKKKLLDATYTMYDYPKGLQSLKNATVPSFNYDQMSSNLDDDATFIKQYFSTYEIDTSQNTFEDQLKAKFRGSDKEIPIKSNQLNMTDIFNYCYTYDQVKQQLQKDVKTINDAANSALDLVDKMVRDGQIANESSELYAGRKKYYSHVYEGYILEDTPPSKPAASPAPSSGGGGTNPSNNNQAKSSNKVQITPGNGTPPSGDSNTFKNNNQNVSGQAQNPNDAANGAKNSGQSAKDVNNRITRYMRLCGQFLAAKASVLEEIYKNYMIIIRTHVRDNVGTEKDTNNNKVQDQGTNYSQTTQQTKDDVNKALNPNPEQTK